MFVLTMAVYCISIVIRISDILKYNWFCSSMFMYMVAFRSMSFYVSTIRFQRAISMLLVWFIRHKYKRFSVIISITTTTTSCRYNFLQLTKRQCKCLCILHAQVKYRLVYDQMRTPIAIKTRISDQDRIPCPFHFWLSTKTNFLLFQNKDTRLNMHRISHCTQIFTYIRTGHAKSERERANRLNVITIKRKTKITTKWHTISDISADVGRLNNGTIFRP